MKVPVDVFLDEDLYNRSEEEAWRQMATAASFPGVRRVAVTPETIFQSGSLGKQFTAVAAMTLVESGQISLDDSIAKFFPDAPAAFKPITVRHLLTHTSGIPDYTGGTIDMRKDYTEDDLAKLAFGLTPEFPAGSRWNYSNTGYVLLGILVHRASGQFYGDVLKARVFDPLGMRTARIISEADIVPNRAAGYRLVKGELKNQEWVAPQLNTTADGSLYFSIRDLIAWDKGLRAKAVLRPESWVTIFSPVTLASGRSFPYGFGWSIDRAGGQPLIQHGGAWQGFKTHLARYLGDEVTIVVLANLIQADPERFVEGIAAILDPALAKPALTPIADHEPEVARRVRDVLAAARDGKLSPGDFAYVRAGFFPEAPKRYARLLSGLGDPRRLDLLERRELGDDRVYTYDVVYEKQTLRLVIAIAPDGSPRKIDQPRTTRMDTDP